MKSHKRALVGEGQIARSARPRLHKAVARAVIGADLQPFTQQLAGIPLFPKRALGPSFAFIPGTEPMRKLMLRSLIPALLNLCAVAPAAACYFGCRPGEGEARAVMDHLLTTRFASPYRIVDFRVTRTADFDMLVGEIRGYEIFYKATVEFPQGAHLDCEPARGAARPEDCSDDPYFSLVRETRPKPGRQFVEAGGRRTFDEDFRFAEIKGHWRGPDGQAYDAK